MPIRTFVLACLSACPLAQATPAPADAAADLRGPALGEVRDANGKPLAETARRCSLVPYPMMRLLLAVPLLAAACGMQPGPETSMKTNESTPPASSTAAMATPASSPATPAARTGVAARLETATFALG